MLGIVSSVVELLRSDLRSRTVLSSNFVTLFLHYIVYFIQFVKCLVSIRLLLDLLCRLLLHFRQKKLRHSFFESDMHSDSLVKVYDARQLWGLVFHPLGLRPTLIPFGLARRELRDGIWKLPFKASHFIFLLNVEFLCPINWYWHAPLVNPIATFYISYFRGWLNFFKDLGILAKFCRVSWGNTRWQCSV